MSKHEPVLKAAGSGAALALRVVPRAGKNEIAGVMENGVIKIRLAAPPVEGKANQSLIRFLAEVLEISATQIEIVAGASGRNKLVVINGVEAEEAQRKLLKGLE